MGAYENPQAIIDRSGEIWGQAFANIGASIGAGISQYYTNKATAKKKQEAEDQRIQAIGYEIEEKTWDEANKNYQKVLEKNPSLADQFKAETALLLDGDGTEENRGAIWAQTQLATRGNLSREDRKKYRDITQRAGYFQDVVQSGGADIMVDLEDMKNIKPGDIGSTHYYVGDTLMDRLTSQYSSYVLSNQKIPGAETKKSLKPDENGNAIIGVETVFDTTTAAGKKVLTDFPELADQVKDGKLVFNWSRNIKEIGDGFIREIPKGADPTIVWQDSNAMDDKGNLTANMVLPSKITRERSGAKGIDQVFTDNIINTQGLKDDSVFQAQIEASVSARIAQDTGDLRSYMKNTLKMGPDYDYSGFMKLPADEKIKILKKEEEDRVIETRLKKYASRSATKEDVAFYNANAKDIQSGEGGITIEEGEQIYFWRKEATMNAEKPASGTPLKDWQTKAIQRIPQYNETAEFVNTINDPESDLTPIKKSEKIAQELNRYTEGKNYITGDQYLLRSPEGKGLNFAERSAELSKKGMSPFNVYNATDQNDFVNVVDPVDLFNDLLSKKGFTTDAINYIEQDYSQHKE
jgi:hypothetical protein